MKLSFNHLGKLVAAGACGALGGAILLIFDSLFNITDFNTCCSKAIETLNCTIPWEMACALRGPCINETCVADPVLMLPPCPSDFSCKEFDSKMLPVDTTLGVTTAVGVFATCVCLCIPKNTPTVRRQQIKDYRSMQN